MTSELFLRKQICMLFHPNSFYLLKLAKLSLWYSLDCQVWVWVCWGQSRVTKGNELTAQDRATPKRRQLNQYKWLCLASWVKYGVWMEYHILSVSRQQIWVIHAVHSTGAVFCARRRLLCEARHLRAAPSSVCGVSSPHGAVFSARGRLLCAARSSSCEAVFCTAF